MITSQLLGNRGEEESKGRVRQVCLAESRAPFLRRKTSRIHHMYDRTSSCATLHHNDRTCGKRVKSEINYTSFF